MKLIGAGVARTATTTQMVALEMLGIGRCYHMRDMMSDLERSVPLWEAARDGNADWATIFDGYATTVDWPSAFFYRELMEVYPDAKVLLSVRDGEAWEASMRETVYAMFYGDSVMAHVVRARYHVDPLWRRYIDVVASISFEQKGPYAGSHHDRASLIGAMERWNEEVKAKEFPILIGVFLSVSVMCLITFRSLLGTALVVVPLALVSVLVYAVMALVGIGLKVSTLPMVALGAGIGVDYGIYLFSRMQGFLKEGLSVHDAYERTLRVTGASIIFTGVTLAIGVATWVFSPLKFQADIGVMLTFMFLVNMLGAIILLPALAAALIRPHAARPASSH